MNRYINLLCILIALCILLLIFLEDSLYSNPISFQILKSMRIVEEDTFLDEGVIEDKLPIVPSNRWIVVTTSRYPTKGIESLFKTGWNVLVVANKYTPSDWNLEGAHFLSLEKQRQLDLKLPGRIPRRKHSHKNIGYLYAILKGAEWIYDTEDNIELSDSSLNQFDYKETVSGIRFRRNSIKIKDNMFNPHSYFGVPNMWPRGFPLEMLSNHSNGADRMVLCREMKTSAIQQGLINGDADVDEVYRLNHNYISADESVELDKFAPAVTLDKGTYAPFNSYNTLLNRKAFFTMFLPTKLDLRTAVTFRSYFAQKLLHMVGETVSFYPPNSVRNQSSSTDLENLEIEKNTYSVTGKLIGSLDRWYCSTNTTAECTIELAEFCGVMGFLKEADVDLIEEWIEDLKRIRYEFPPLTASTSYMASEAKDANCVRAHLDFSRNSQAKSIEQRHKNMEEVCEFCEKNGDYHLNNSRVDEIREKQMKIEGLAQKKNTALIVTANWPWKSGFGFLQRLYQPYFAVTIFCGTLNWRGYLNNETFPSPIRSSFNYIHLSQQQISGGGFVYYCLSKARDLRLKNIEGYYMMADDAIFNFWHPIKQDTVVLPVGIVETDQVHWVRWYGEAAAKKLVDEIINKKYINDNHVQSVWKKYDELSMKKLKQSGVKTMTTFTYRCFVDMFYIPTSYLDFVADMFSLMREADLFLEIAVGKIMHVMDLTAYPNQTEYLWYDGKREIYEQFYNSSNILVHPIKLGTSMLDKKSVKQFCGSVVKSFVESLYNTDVHKSPLLSTY